MVSSGKKTALLRSYEKHLRNDAAYLAEARICVTANASPEISQHFVRAFEGGTVDCAISLSPKPLHGTMTDKTYQVYEDGEEILPLDVKDITSIYQKRAVLWNFRVSGNQAMHCQVFILGATADPNFVAILPRSLFWSQLTREPKDQNIHSRSFRPYWTLHPLPAFPPEYAPFMVSISGLGRALSDLRTALIDSSQPWQNRHTGMIFDKLIPFERFRPDLLYPTWLPWKNAVEAIKPLRKAFKNVSREYSIEHVVIHPILGDFKIVHLPNLQEYFVEAKSGLWRTAKDSDTNTLTMEHTQHKAGLSPKPIFSWKSTWDYLFTTRPSGNPRALLIPRDKIPKEWWNTPTGEDEQVWLQWPIQHTSNFRDFTVDLKDDLRLVNDIVRILQTHSKPRDSIEMSPNMPLSVAEAFDQIDRNSDLGQTLPSDEAWSSADYQRGFGSYKHRKPLRGPTNEAWAAEVLMELCRQSRRGLVLDVGSQNSTCRFVLVQYEWSKSDIAEYDHSKEPPCRVWHFSQNTPVIPLSFLPLLWKRGWHPHGIRNSEFVIPKIKKRPPTLVICELYSFMCARLTHARFVLTSDLFPQTLHRNYIELNDAVIDEFRVDEEELVDAILSVLNGEEQTTIGFADREVRTASYLYSLKEVLQAGIENFDAPGEDEEDRGEY